MSRYINPQPRYVDDRGQPLVGGKLFFYSAGTVTERDTYSDASFTVPNTNPVILDANGRPQTNIFLNGSYKVVLKDALDNTIWEKDPVGGAIGVAAFDDWINDATYDAGDIVTASDGYYYQSLTNGNIGLNPTIETNDWQRVQLIAKWRNDVTYDVDDIALGSDDILYRSLSGSNLNNDPVSDAVNWSSVKDYWGVADGVATLDSAGKIPSAQIPPIAITDVYVVADQAARLALDAQVGDIAVQNDNNTAYILQSLPASTDGNWIEFGIQNFGSAAFRNIGTGTDEVPDKEILDTRLGTTGNLGNAAQRNVGTGATNLPEYQSVVGVSNTQTITGAKTFSSGSANPIKINREIGTSGAVSGIQCLNLDSPIGGFGIAQGGLFRIYNAAGDAYSFQVDVENGNVLIGDSGNTDVGALIVDQTVVAGGAAFILRNRQASNSNGMLVDVASGTGAYIADFRINNSSQARIDKSGGVTATSYNRSSDANLKRIKRELNCTREELDSIGVYLFEWLDVEGVNEHQKGTEDSGVIAQELLAVDAFKHCVHMQENGKYTVDYGKAAFIYAILDRKLTKRGE